jgi:16S rRNA (cytosine1402-N4)-methyltransferase
MTMAAGVLTDENADPHVSVMPGEVVSALAPRGGGIYVDATAGWGGHSRALLDAAPDAKVIAFDRDPAAVRAARGRLLTYGSRVRVVRARFGALEEELAALGVRAIDGLVADLGVSSPQLDDPTRGLSFRSAGPLDMRMDPDEGETALELIGRTSQDELADIIYALGEERRSRRVARCIKQALERDELRTTVDLRRAVVRAVGPRRIGGTDPATRTFQALRMAVNRELDELAAVLDQASRLVAPGGVACFISFHSLEDRLVKRAFAARSVWAPLTKKPQRPGDAEQEQNPRSRSAKLRAARRQADETDELERSFEVDT